MTVLEMHTAVLLGLDKSASFEVAAFEPEDIDYWLNEAQLELIKQKVFGNNYRKEKYGEGIKRADDLATIIKYTGELQYGVELVDHPYHPNVAYVDIATHIPDYLFYIGSDVLINDPYAPTANTPHESEFVEENVIGKLIATPYNEPVLKNAYLYLKKNQVNVIYDPYATLDSIYVSYIKQPGKLVRSAPGVGEVTTSELPEQVHQELVALTISLMLENIESPRFQTQFLTLNNKE